MLQEQVIHSFRRHYKREPAILVRAPGRVSVLGSHVDYNEGWVLPGAIDRAIWLAAAPNQNDTVQVNALDMQKEASFRLSHLERQNSWVDYPAGVAWALDRAGHPVVGMEVAFAGDIPIGAGVSSSAAVEVAFIMAWESLSGLQLDGVTRALLGQQVENGFLGVQSGIMDQFASVHSAADHLILLDCRTLAHQLVPLPAGTAIMVADSGVRRELAHSEYNIRRRQCEEAVKILRQYLPGIRALRDVSTEEFELYAHRLPDVLRRRAKHVVEECARALTGVEMLRQGDLVGFGRLMRQSHVSSRDLYEVSIPELNILAAAAWQVPGCYGAHLTGAGFGGCVIALVDKAAAPEVQEFTSDTFATEFDREPMIFVSEIAAGAAVTWL